MVHGSSKCACFISILHTDNMFADTVSQHLEDYTNSNASGICIIHEWGQ